MGKCVWATPVALLLLSSVWQGATAEDAYPSRRITVIVPFAAGGPTDVVARLVAEHMSRTLGQQLVVENVGGAGGSTGMTRTAQADPDGYTIAVGNTGTQSAAPALYANLKYDPATSFAQVGIINYTPQAIVAKKDTPAAHLKAFLGYLKDNDGQLSCGHAGLGSVSHVSGTVFNAKFGLKPGLVAYRGTAPALADLMAGKIDYMLDQALNVIPQIQAGTIKAYAVAAPERLESLPDLPTAREAGVDFIFSAWNAMVAPKDTPQPIVDKLVDALGKALDDPAITERLVELGSTAPKPEDRGPAGLQKLVESEIARITPVLKEALASATTMK
jgi:tripartite-type tricarboxylate transporter receptor subunit TctC